MTHINEQAERAVIAALMRNPDGKEILRLGITAELFAQDATREAFLAIRALILDGHQPDAATLKNAVQAATLIEIETSLSEHVSAANLAYHVTLLKTCQRERQIHATRQRLAQAAATGAPEHELQAILESIRQIGHAESGKGRFVDVGELCSLPPTESWLVKGYLTTDSLTVLFGDPGCGKSFLAIDIAGHVACGLPWRGCSVKPGKVLYIAGEGRNGLSKRFRAWFERHGETPRNIQICTAPIALTDPAGIAALVAEIQAMPEAPALIVIDTVNRNFGPGDENATADMTRAVAGLDAIRNATGAALLGLHHSGHGDKSRGRGSSVLRASVDVEFAVEKFDRTVQVRCTKAKDFDHPAPLAWTLEKQPLPWADEDGTPMDSAVLESGELHEPPPPPNSARMGENQTKALRLLDKLHRNARNNLEASGHDPNNARVSRADWYREMELAGFKPPRRSECKRELLKRGLITEFGHFVAPSSPVTDFVTEVITEQLRTSEFGNRNEVTLRYGGSIEPRNSVTDVARNSVTANDQQPAAAGHQPLNCSWDQWGDRLITKCDDPEPNADQTGCANCGASKPAPGASLNGPHIGPVFPDEGLI